MKIDPDKCPQATAAKVIGMSVRHFQRLQPPRNADNSYNLTEVVRWRFQTIEDKAMADESGDERSPALERMREARAAIYEMELAEKRGELWPADEIKTEVAGAAKICRDVLLAMPARLAPLCVGAEVAEIYRLLDEGVRQGLDDLGDALKPRMHEEQPPAPAA